jgi:diguanylate cyclase (GGDEF)-like protein
MHSASLSLQKWHGNSGSSVLLASPDSELILRLQEIFHSLGLRVEVVNNGSAAMCALDSLEDSAIVLLDNRLPGMATGQLLAALHETGVHKRCSIAVIAEPVSDSWIVRLRAGVFDDIVPRSADAATWSTHLSTMQRGRELSCELEQLREASLVEMQHDRVTGTFNRETMLTLLFRETDRVQRLRGSLCLVLFGIDDFRHWNCELGRDACDGLLREVAARTNRVLRSYDMLGRIGGDLFLLALPGCSAINAVMMAERLRMGVFDEPFAVKDGQEDFFPVRLTACFGVTSSRGRSPVVLLREAEQTVALAKRSGPDTIRCASEMPWPENAGTSMAQLFPEVQQTTA